MNTIITDEIRKAMLDSLESGAEFGITEDDYLFKLNMDLYPHLRDHLGITNNTEEKDIKVKYMSLDEAKSDLLDDYCFGYQFWDRGDYLTLKSWVDAITEDVEDEAESDKLYDIVEAEEKALHAELEAQLKKVISYNSDVKWFLEDVKTLEELKAKKEYSELDSMYSDAVDEVEEDRQAELITNQIKNIVHYVEKYKNNMRVNSANAIKELANNDNFINISNWGNKEAAAKIDKIKLALRLANDFITHLENNSDVEDVLNGCGYDDQEKEIAMNERFDFIDVKDVK